MADFSTTHKKVMNNEGGYADNKNDPGGETYKGISRVYHSEWSGWKAVDKAKEDLKIPQKTGETINYNKYAPKLNSILARQADTQQAVLDFYKKNFWEKNRLDEVKNPVVATWVYDHLVNADRHGAEWIQKAAGVKADGVIGPESIKAINAADPATFLRAAKNNAVAGRLKVIEEKPKKGEFLESWIRRDGLTEETITEIMAIVRPRVRANANAEAKAKANGNANFEPEAVLTDEEVNDFKEKIKNEGISAAYAPAPAPAPESALEMSPAHGPSSVPAPAPAPASALEMSPAHGPSSLSTPAPTPEAVPEPAPASLADLPSAQEFSASPMESFQDRTRPLMTQ